MAKKSARKKTNDLQSETGRNLYYKLTEENGDPADRTARAFSQLVEILQEKKVISAADVEAIMQRAFG